MTSDRPAEDRRPLPTFSHESEMSVRGHARASVHNLLDIARGAADVETCRGISPEDGLPFGCRTRVDRAASYLRGAVYSDGRAAALDGHGPKGVPRHMIRYWYAGRDDARAGIQPRAGEVLNGAHEGARIQSQS